MNGDSACFSRKSDEWETPQALFNKLDREFVFTLDAAATEENVKCSRYIDQAGDALRMDWKQHSQGGNVWLNPPYSQIGPFMKKAYEESQNGVTVVCLIPSRTDTKYWHDYVMKAAEIRFIRGRVKFCGGPSSAPFPSCIVVFLKNHYGPVFVSSMEAA